MGGRGAASTVPITTNLQLQLDASTLSYSNGASVAAWPDSSPNLRTTTVGGTAPTFQTTGINGHPGVLFAGLSDVAVTYAPALDMNLDSTVFVATNVTSQHQGAFVGKGTVGANSAYIYYVQNVAAANLNIDRPWIVGGTPSTLGVTFGTSYVLTARVNGTAVTHFRNGSANGSSTLANGQAGTTPLHVGSFQGTQDFLRATVGELLVYNVSLSDADRGTVESYLRTKWSI